MSYKKNSNNNASILIDADDSDDDFNNNNNMADLVAMGSRTADGTIYPAFCLGQHVVVQQGAQFLYATVEDIETREFTQVHNNGTTSTSVTFFYYVHFADQDRRLDKWVEADILRNATNNGVRPKNAQQHSSKTQGKSSTATRTRRQLLEQQSQQQTQSQTQNTATAAGGTTLSSNNSRSQSVVNDNNNNNSVVSSLNSNNQQSQTIPQGGNAAPIVSVSHASKYAQGHRHATAHGQRDSKFFDRPKNVATFIIGDVEVESWYFSPYLFAHPKVRQGFRDYNKLNAIPDQMNMTLLNNTSNNNKNNHDSAGNYSSSFISTTDNVNNIFGNISARNFVLHLCPYCLEPAFDHNSLLFHLVNCLRRPPGREVYRDPSKSVIVFECDGAVHSNFAKNLALVSKAFLEHKSLDYDMTPFVFYVVCRYDEFGSVVASREQLENNTKQRKNNYNENNQSFSFVIKKEDISSSAEDNDDDDDDQEEEENKEESDDDQNDEDDEDSDEEERFNVYQDAARNENDTPYERLIASTMETTSGCRIMGYFSREKQNSHSHNLSCILTLPQFQGCGVGRFMIDMSYDMSIREGKPGTPETPLSDFGEKTYRSVWKERVLEVISGWMTKDQTRTTSIEEISRATGMIPKDVSQALADLKILDTKALPVVKMSNIKPEVLREYIFNKIRKRRKNQNVIFDTALFHWFPQWYLWNRSYGEALRCDNDGKLPLFGTKIPTDEILEGASKIRNEILGFPNNNNNNKSSVQNLLKNSNNNNKNAQKVNSSKNDTKKTSAKSEKKKSSSATKKKTNSTNNKSKTTTSTKKNLSSSSAQSSSKKSTRTTKTSKSTTTTNKSSGQRRQRE